MADEMHIAELIARQLRQEATADDQQELKFWRDASPANRVFLDEKVQEDVIIEALQAGYRVNRDATWKKFEVLRDNYLQSQEQPAPVIRPYRRFAAAAVFIVLAGIGVYLWQRAQKQEEMNTGPVLSVTKVSPSGGRLVLGDE